MCKNCTCKCIGNCECNILDKFIQYGQIRGTKFNFSKTAIAMGIGYAIGGKETAKFLGIHINVMTLLME